MNYHHDWSISTNTFKCNCIPTCRAALGLSFGCKSVQHVMLLDVKQKQWKMLTHSLQLRGMLRAKRKSADSYTHTPPTEIGNSLTPSVWLPGVKLSPERNAVEIRALNNPEIPGACRALLQQTRLSTHEHTQIHAIPWVQCNDQAQFVVLLPVEEQRYSHQYCRTWSAFSPPDNTFRQ